MVDQADIKLAFGEALRKARIRSGLSQEHLALETNLDGTFISLFERGKRQPSQTTLFALSSKLGVLLSDLLASVENSLA